MRIPVIGLLLLLGRLCDACPCATCTLKTNILKSARQTALCAYLMKTLAPSLVIPDIFVPLVRLCPVLEGFAVVKTSCDGNVNSVVKVLDPVTGLNALNPVVKAPLEPVNLIGPSIKPVEPINVFNPIVRTPLDPLRLLKPTEPIGFSPIVRPPFESLGYLKPIEPIGINPVARPPLDPLTFLKPIEPISFNPVGRPPPLDPISFLKPVDPLFLNSFLKSSVNLLPRPNPALTVLSKTSVDAVLPAPAYVPQSVAVSPQPQPASTPQTDPSKPPSKQENPPKGQYCQPSPPTFVPPQLCPFNGAGAPSQGFSVSSNSLLLQNYK